MCTCGPSDVAERRKINLSKSRHHHHHRHIATSASTTINNQVHEHRMETSHECAFGLAGVGSSRDLFSTRVGTPTRSRGAHPHASTQNSAHPQGQKKHGTTKRESHLWDRCNLDDGVLHDVRRLPRGLSCRGHRHGSPTKRASVAFNLVSPILVQSANKTAALLAPVCDSPLRKLVWITMYARTHTHTRTRRSHKRAHTKSCVHTRSDPRFPVAAHSPVWPFRLWYLFPTDEVGRPNK